MNRKIDVQNLVNIWIKELSEAGYSYDNMIAIFRESKRQYDNYKKTNKKA